MLSEKEIIELVKNGWLVTNFIDMNTQIQPAGVDLSVGKIFVQKTEGVLDFDNSKRVLPELEEILTHTDYWELEPGAYIIVPNEYIKLPKNMAAIVLPRSSAAMCGLAIHSALWEPGYEGRGIIYVTISKRVKIFKNTRFGQIIFFYTTGNSNYNGIFKGEDVLKHGKRV